MGKISTPSVLFYSDNKLDENNFNPALANIIEKFIGKQNEFYEVSNLQSRLKSSNGVDPISFQDFIEEQVNSLLVNYRWHQWTPYNTFLNESVQANYPVGYVTIALGQIIAYHKHYDYGGLTFEWEKMESESVAVLDSYFELKYFLHQVFVGVKVKAGAHSTSATFTNAKGFMTEIGYETTTTVLTFDYEKIKTELNAKRPIYVRGVDKLGEGTGGHAFICDGYKTVGTYMIENGVKPASASFKTNYVHINWGWKEDSFAEGYDGWSFAEGLNVATKKGIHFYNVDNRMLLLEPK